MIACYSIIIIVKYSDSIIEYCIVVVYRVHKVYDCSTVQYVVSCPQTGLWVLAIQLKRKSPHWITIFPYLLVMSIS